MPDTTKKLELNKPEFNARTLNFFNLMGVEDFQKKFFENPVAITSNEFGINLPSKTVVSKVNKLIYGLLSDSKFNEWSKDFQKNVESSFLEINSSVSISDIIKISKIKANQERFKKEFIDSIINHLSPSSYAGLIENGKINPGLIAGEDDIAILLLVFVAVVVVAVVALGVTRPTESLSRINVNLVMNQIANQHQLNIRKNIK